MSESKLSAVFKLFRNILRSAVFGFIWRVTAFTTVLLLLILTVFAFVRAPPGLYMVSEGLRLGGLERTWVPLKKIKPVMARSIVAAEDANFCNHWGIEWKELFEVIEEGSNRGASTISQQVAKNLFLWHGRSFVRKGIEAYFTVLIELTWPKRRILYLPIRKDAPCLPSMNCPLSTSCA